MKMNLKIKKKRYSFLALLALLVLSSFFIGNFANAGLSDAVSGIVGHIVQFLVWILGGILFVLIYILIWIAQYNDFIHSGAVTNGWVIVRDLCNMFFILILLIIAFATILRRENYNAKKLLPKLLIMAVLINFSKTICGLIIDFAQVIMLTFVNGFKDMGSANLTSMLGIKDILAIDADASDVSLLSVIGSYILALLYAIISVIVVLVIVAVLVMRMIMLWVYIVLSPLAFLLSAFPAGQKYASQWWSEFSKQVVVGPILAFFIWLSFVSIGTNNADTILNTPRPGDTGKTTQISSAPIAGVAKAGTPDNMIKFIISIGMLVGGLMVTQQLGGAAGSIAGNAIGKIKAGGLGAAKLPFKGGAALAGYGIDKLHQKTGVDLNVGRVWKGIKEKRAEIKGERYMEGTQKARDVMAERGRLYGALALSGTPGTAWEQVTSIKGLRQRFKGGKRMAELRKELLPGAQHTKFKADYAKLNKEEKSKKVDDLTKKSYELDDAISRETDGGKKVKLQQERESAIKNLEFARENKKDFSEDELRNLKNEAESKQKEFNKYVPLYDFEARVAEQRVVSEKASKIKDITDASELSRILVDAIEEKDKAMIKAITKKMAQNGDDNEFLQPLAGRTDAEGLQIFMDKLKNEVGFSEQEAYALGSEISNFNKKTNHYAAAGAFAMENGAWRKTSKAEQVEFRSVETGKLNQQTLLRDIGRLSYGRHDEKGVFHIDEGGIILLKKLDNPGAIQQLAYNMNENAALHLKPLIKTLRDNNVISQNLANAIEERAARIETDFGVAYGEAIDSLKKLS